MSSSQENPIIAAIDVGTNSVHMIIAKTSARGFELITREKEVVRLGENMRENLILDVEAIDRGINALKRMRTIAEAHGATIRAVATSAVREAENAHIFIQRAKRDAGIKIEVISGTEEARLIYLGVQQAVSIGVKSTLVIDIGGGSTELVVSQDGHIKFAQSVKIGAVRISNRYFPKFVATSKKNDECRSYIASVIAPLAPEIKKARVEDVIVSSGTAETIARIVSLMREDDPPASLNNFIFTSKELMQVEKRILEAESLEERREIPGLDERRSEIILGGIIILTELCAVLDIQRFVYSDFALREGLLLDTMRAFGIRKPRDQIDASRDSVIMLAERCSVDLVHSTFIASLSQDILNQLKDQFDLDDVDHLLYAAAMLSNVGLAISHSRHHIHSQYIVRNAELMGFHDNEISMIALACRYHRKSGPKITHSDYAALNQDDQDRVDLIAGIVRIATSLDRSHDQSTKILSIRREPTERGHNLIFRCSTRTNIDSLILNLYTAEQRSQVLGTFLGDNIIFENSKR